MGFAVAGVSLTFLVLNKLASFLWPLNYVAVRKKRVAIAFVATLLVAFGYVDLACTARDLSKNVQISCNPVELADRVCRRLVRLSSMYGILIASS